MLTGRMRTCLVANRKWVFSDDDADDEGVGRYNEASIRYRGGHIPSRSFRMLQSMTGEDGTTTPPGEHGGN